ncbi:MAG: AraC family transcriptional regulator [Gammaproteobacteria bacterium]
MNLSLPAAPGCLPFSDMALFRASQLDEAHEQIARLVNPHRIAVLSDPCRLNVEFNGIREENISFLHIQYGAAVDVRPDESKEYFFVQTTLEGFSLVLKDKNEYPAPENHTLVVSPDRPYRMRIAAGTKRMVVGIRVAALEQHLAYLCGHALDDSLVFAADGNSREVSSIWFGHIKNLYSLFKLSPTSYENEMCRRHHYDATCSLLLNLFSHNYSGILSRGSTKVASRRCHMATEYMRDNLCRGTTVSDVANHVGLSVRALQVAFQRYYDVTPSEMLRNLRLDAVKDALEHIEDSDTITRILLDYGVSSIGHFAAQFRKRFGVAPCEVMRASRHPLARKSEPTRRN